MEPSSPEDILKKAESSESFINKLVIAWREKQWVKLLLILGFLCLAVLHPDAVGFALEKIGLPRPEWYKLWIWLVATISFFIAAFVVALRTTPTKFPDAPSEKSIIKGLRPYTAEDSELFAKLQRGRMLQDCLTACDDRDFCFGILNGESGTGKTSFLQAGFCPSLAKKNFRPIYVKLTEIAPLDSIREAFAANNEIKRQDAENKNLFEILQLATKENSKPLIIVIDQFEQFFVSHKSKAEREVFIQEMSAWYEQRDLLPVKILFSIRGDFFYRLSEFQDAMNYTLTVQDNFRLEKFSPEEAANVFRVIAEAEKIECDESFIKEITAKELSDREDNLVSPVDVQILSWIIAGQKTKDEKAFNRQAFNKVGGVEGLLESFLKKTLDVQTESNKQTAVKVLLALTDLERYTRAGALSLDEIQTKLKETISVNDVAKSVEWLTNSGVRLITPTDDKKETQTLYELAHERIIPALRKLANKEFSEPDRASQLLDRRFNEWTGNNNSRRYLLTLKEWLLVRRNKSLISLGANKERKENFIAQSKRRFKQVVAAITAVSLLAVGSFGVYQWNESRLETKMKHAQNRLIELLERNYEADTIKNLALLLPLLGNKDFDKLTAENLLRPIEKLTPDSQADVLNSLAESYIKLGKNEEALNILNKVQTLILAGKIDSFFLANILNSLAVSYIKLGNNEAASNGLNKVQILILAGKIDSFSQANLLNYLAKNYIELGKNEEALNILNKVQTLAGKLTPDFQASVLNSLAENYIELGKNEEALNILNKVQTLILAGKHTPDFQANLLNSLAENYIELGKNEEALNILNKVQTLILAGKIDSFSQASVLNPLAKNYIKLGNNEAASNGLNKVQTLAEKLTPGSQAGVLNPLAKRYIELGKNEEALNILNKVQTLILAGKLTPDSQASLLNSLAESYIKLGKNEEALLTLAKGRETALKARDNNKNYELVTIAILYAKLKEEEKALIAIQSISDEGQQIIAYLRVLAIWRSPENFALLE